MARNPRPRIIFEGVSVCPIGENNFRIEYETVIECGCRGVANIRSPGVYKILANQGVGRERIRRFDPELDDPLERIRYVRVFPARAEPIVSEGRRYIRVNDLDYEHFPWGELELMLNEFISKEGYFAKIHEVDLSSYRLNNEYHLTVSTGSIQ